MSKNSFGRCNCIATTSFALFAICPILACQVGCGSEENTVIEQSATAEQEMEDYGAMMEQQNESYGK